MMSVTTVFQLNLIFGSLNASSFKAEQALSSSFLCMTWTDEARFVRKVASSIAVSPPPITATFLPLKKKPSQTAQFETPLPMSLISDGMFRRLGFAPVATTMERARTVAPPEVTSSNGYLSNWTFTMSSWRSLVPSRWAWPFIRSMSSGPMMGSTKPG